LIQIKKAFLEKRLFLFVSKPGITFRALMHKFLLHHLNDQMHVYHVRWQYVHDGQPFRGYLIRDFLQLLYDA